MQRVTRAELEALAPDWDAFAVRDPGLDPFCSRSAWQLAFHDAFEPERELWCARTEDSLVVLAESRRPSAPGLLEPLENMWGFGSPLIGPTATALLADALAERPRAVLLLGLPADRSRWAPLAGRLAGRYLARALEPTHRFVASLAGGLEGWLSRRTVSFRRNLRQAERRASAVGVRLERLAGPSDDELETLYATVLDVEARSWKGRAGRGADRDPMRSFYAGLWPRLARRGQLRLIVAEHAGRAVGYLHGARVGDHFRGLQFSFDADWRGVGLGNVLQLEMLRWLCEDGALTYDLGGESAYKSRWAESAPPLLGLLLQPRG